MRWILISLLAGLAACSTPEKEPLSFTLPDNAEALIASHSSKTWMLARRLNNGTRMNMGDCFLSYRITYKADHSLIDNNGQQSDCGLSLQARWKISFDTKDRPYLVWRSEQLPQLLGTDKDSKNFRILALDSTQMVLLYTHRQFSNTPSTITDVYVPAGTRVADRDFHW